MVNWSLYSEVISENPQKVVVDSPRRSEAVVQPRRSKRSRSLWQVWTLISQKSASAFWHWAIKGGADTVTYLVLLFVSGIVMLQVILWFLMH